MEERDGHDDDRMQRDVKKKKEKMKTADESRFWLQGFRCVE